jgi:hypothetical protein
MLYHSTITGVHYKHGLVLHDISYGALIAPALPLFGRPVFSSTGIAQSEKLRV